MIVCAIQFRSDGSGVCLNTDTIPLQTLGRIEAKRASSIEFNAHRQTWEVRFADNPRKVVFRHASRKACVDWEVKTLNERILSVKI